MKFPEDWQDCPPEDAEPANGVYFRIGRHSPPTALDFQSQAELGQALRGDPCMRRGLSTLRDLSEARHATRLFPGLGSIVYRGELGASHGQSKLTSTRKSPSHTTWWPYPDVDRVMPFSVMEV
jgi:hypothetical protein